MSMGIMMVFGILGMALFLAGLSWFMLKLLKTEIKNQQEQFLKLAQSQFETSQAKASQELELRRQSVETTVKSLNEELDKYQKLMHEFEKDRDLKYGNLANELKTAAQTNQRLQDATNQLNNILGNVKLRGQWGERMAEDVIRYAGLLEGVNFLKQKKLERASSKPDFTFLLPEDRKINMDVKFPLDNYTRMINAPDPREKEDFAKDFIRNVKERIKEIQSREYINPAENTLDFVMLFIPNEQVYGFIQEKIPDLIDTALKQKVVLCSPFTLYAMLSVIRQAHENFRYEKDIKKIIILVEEFVKIYARFKDRFEAVGDTLVKLENQYGDLRSKSFKQIDTKIRHIENYKKGQHVFLQEESPRLDLAPVDVDE